MKGEHKKIYEESKILYEIYRMRGLTISQLVEVMFKSKVYAYRYLKKLEREEWLSSGYDSSGKKRLAKVYFVTDQAIERLKNEGYIENGILAKFNRPPKIKLKYTIQTNEVYAALTPYGIHMYDSREWKLRNKMDRNNLVRGGLKMRDGREIGLYLFFSKEQIEGAGLAEETLNRFITEIQKFPQKNRLAILCYNPNIYERIVDAVSKDEKILARKELMIIPMGKENFGFNLLRISRDEKERKATLEQILNARLYNEHIMLKGNKELFTQYVADYGNKETYVVDYLSLNLPVLKKLELNYHESIYKQDGREVDLVCWSANRSELEERFKNYPHINIVPVPIKNIKETYISQIEKSKLI
ncbi:helix-turn-helix domain-containing protein [Robertmurraya massiliosenegalensis]|uniref:replication-relaxation family protein n=1 Tax=Robertmurraya massiliosenegalensis TaxID=1287657 RepID=UPI00030C5BC5|nr:replication-relaxation family protein [Robertmurraya massiliosenegalensis]